MKKMDSTNNKEVSKLYIDKDSKLRKQISHLSFYVHGMKENILGNGEDFWVSYFDTLKDE